MAKITLNTIGSRYGSIDALNANFDAIEAAFENTLSRDGTGPNNLEANLDANSQRIINLANGINNQDAVTVAQVNGIVAAASSDIIASLKERQDATYNQTVFNLSSITYVPGSNNLSVYIDGVRQYVGESYTETDSNTVTFSAGLPLGAQVLFITNETVDTANLQASAVHFTPAGAAAISRTVESKLRERVSVKDFGAVGNGVADDTAAIQAAIDAVANTPDYLGRKYSGGTVYFPMGTYQVTSTIVLKAGVSIEGVAPNKWHQDCRIRANTLNGPLLVNDSVNQANDSPNSPQTGDDGLPKHSQGSSIKNIFIDQQTTTSPDCDAIRLHNLWVISIEHCTIRARNGFAIRSLDCNVQHIKSNYLQPGVFCESMADSIWMDNEIGPVGIPAYDTDYISSIFWVTGGTGANSGLTWLNTISNNFIYNAGDGVTKACVTTSGVQNITCNGHGYTDGTPVIYETSNTSFVLSLTKTFYVKVVDANTVKLAESRKNLNDGVFVTPASTGSGTQVLRIGAPTNLFVNNGASNNIFSNNRFDQAKWSGVDYRGSRKNTLMGNNIIMSGRDNGTGQPGVKMYATTDEHIIGNMIDGVTVGTYPYGTSNQSIGIQTSSACVRPKLSANQLINHTDTNVDNNSSSLILDDLEAVFISPYQFIARTGTPVLTSVAGRRQVWALDASTVESVTAYTYFPAKSFAGLTWNVKVMSINLGAGTGDVNFNVQIEEFADGDDLSVNETAYSWSITPTMGAQNILKTSTLSLKYTGENSNIASVTVQRVATSGTDTLTNDVGFAGLLFTPNI